MGYELVTRAARLKRFALCISVRSGAFDTRIWGVERGLLDIARCHRVLSELRLRCVLATM